jgi:hypothetical protein
MVIDRHGLSNIVCTVMQQWNYDALPKLGVLALLRGRVHLSRLVDNFLSV